MFFNGIRISGSVSVLSATVIMVMHIHSHHKWLYQIIESLMRAQFLPQFLEKNSWFWRLTLHADWSVDTIMGAHWSTSLLDSLLACWLNFAPSVALISELPIVASLSFTSILTWRDCYLFVTCISYTDLSFNCANTNILVALGSMGQVNM